MNVLLHNDLLELHGAIISARLGNSRPALLAGIDGSFVATLPHLATSADQIMSDLAALNSTGVLTDGTVPLATWLKNALVLSRTQMEGAVFRRLLERLQRSLDSQVTAHLGTSTHQELDSPRPPNQLQQGALANNNVPPHLACCLLFAEALAFAWQAGYGSGPTTELHRRLDLAEKWRWKGLQLLAEDHVHMPGMMIGLLPRIAENLAWFLSEIHAAVPAAGDDGHRRDNEHFLAARAQAYRLRQQLTEQLAQLEGFSALERDPRKWRVLGFECEAEFGEYLVPSTRTLAQSESPMPRDLFERLASKPDFTISALSDEGYTRDVIMDCLNALLRDRWATWTTGGGGVLTPVGKRLLGTLLAKTRGPQ